MSNYYNANYFGSSIFDYNYSAIAEAIVNTYDPKRVIEFGCGNGELAKELAKRNIEVIAIDGYSKPNYEGYTLVKFFPLDMNNSAATEKLLSEITGKFDVAISLEVAEHLDPAISGSLVKWMTNLSNAVVFSAAVPKQDGDGHINCRTHMEWYNFFAANGFEIVDTIRHQLRDHDKVGLWYKLNAIDYIRTGSVYDTPLIKKGLIERLVATVSFAASEGFYYKREMEIRNWALNLQPVKASVKFRNFLTRLLGKTSIEF